MRLRAGGVGEKEEGLVGRAWQVKPLLQLARSL